MNRNDELELEKAIQEVLTDSQFEISNDHRRQLHLVGAVTSYLEQSVRKSQIDVLFDVRDSACDHEFGTLDVDLLAEQLDRKIEELQDMLAVEEVHEQAAL